jgi:hypothetical protein
MSVKSTALWVSLALFMSPVAAGAQSASQVIERYITAIGGKKALEAIVSTDVSGSVSSADGRAGAFVQRSKRPHLLYVSVSSGDSRWRIGFNGRAAWQDDNVDGTRTLFGEAASRVRAEASYVNTRFVLPDKISQIYLVGREQLRGHAVIVIMMLAPDGVTRTLFFDADSYLLVKDEQQTDAGVEERFFDDYRRVGQVKEPHQIEWHRSGETFVIAIERIAHNSTVDGQAFDAPVPPTGPRLDLDAVLSTAARAEQQTQPVPTSYTYTSTATFVRFDEQGHAKSQEGESFEVFNVGGRVVSRLIKKRGGEALSEAERQREDERVSKTVREYERQRLLDPAVRRGTERGSGFVIVLLPLGAPDS